MHHHPGCIDAHRWEIRRLGGKPTLRAICLSCNTHASTHLDVDYLMKVLLYLLRRCYGVIYRLLSSSEPVSEELMPIVTVPRRVPPLSQAYLRNHRPTNSRQ